MGTLLNLSHTRNFWPQDSPFLPWGEAPETFRPIMLTWTLPFTNEYLQRGIISPTSSKPCFTIEILNIKFLFNNNPPLIKFMYVILNGSFTHRTRSPLIKFGSHIEQQTICLNNLIFFFTIFSNCRYSKGLLFLSRPLLVLFSTDLLSENFRQT